MRDEESMPETSIQGFSSDDFGQIRALAVDSEPWFVASDVCSALGIATNHVRESLDDDEVSNLPITEIDPERGGKAPLIISEAGLYSLVLKSRKPEAKAFKRWVTHEVLPAIRRDGGYMVARDETPEETMARAVIIAQKTIARQEQMIADRDARIEEMRPKAFFADAVSDSDGSITVGDLAKILKQNGFDTGRNRLFELLRKEGYLCTVGSDKNSPSQRAMELGLFRIKEYAVEQPDGRSLLRKTTKVTGKGQRYFIERYAGTATP